MEMHIAEIAERIRNLRNLMDITEEEMAKVTDLTVEKYHEFESGKIDFSFTFLLKSSERFGVDITELLTGDDPKLSFYTVVRRGKGPQIERRKGFGYRHLAHLMKNRIAEPFIVTAPYVEAEQIKPIEYSTHEGQEFDIVFKGILKVELEGHVEVLNEGDSIYYDSGHKHGMIAIGGKDCQFLAVVIKPTRLNKENNKYART
jgi:quercetin dioxygenase-like cupin family protein/DNA-binding XRE family transcriptional regulator